MANVPTSIPPAPQRGALERKGVPRERALLAARVGELRCAKGWTFYGLSKESGIHATYLREIEAGARNPSLDLLVKLARSLHLQSLEQLFGPLPSELAVTGEADDESMHSG